MKVKIIKALKPMYWYTNQIGQTFEVEYSLSPDYFDFTVIETGNGIRRDDCVIVKPFYPIKNKISDKGQIKLLKELGFKKTKYGFFIKKHQVSIFPSLKIKLTFNVYINNHIGSHYFIEDQNFNIIKKFRNFNEIYNYYIENILNSK